MGFNVNDWIAEIETARARATILTSQWLHYFADSLTVIAFVCTIIAALVLVKANKQWRAAQFALVATAVVATAQGVAAAFDAWRITNDNVIAATTPWYIIMACAIAPAYGIETTKYPKRRTTAADSPEIDEPTETDVAELHRSLYDHSVRTLGQRLRDIAAMNTRNRADTRRIYDAVIEARADFYDHLTTHRAAIEDDTDDFTKTYERIDNESWGSHDISARLDALGYQGPVIDANLHVLSGALELDKIGGTKIRF